MWLTLKDHPDACLCLGCVLLNDVTTREAQASTALDRDPYAQTISLDDWRREQGDHREW